MVIGIKCCGHKKCYETGVSRTKGALIGRSSFISACDRWCFINGSIISNSRGSSTIRNSSISCNGIRNSDIRTSGVTISSSSSSTGTAAALATGAAAVVAIAGTAGAVGSGWRSTGSSLSEKTSHSEDWYHDNDKLIEECDNIKTTYAYKSTKILFGRLDQMLAFVEMSKDNGFYDKYMKLNKAYDLIKKKYNEGSSVNIDLMQQLQTSDWIISEVSRMVKSWVPLRINVNQF